MYVYCIYVFILLLNPFYQVIKARKESPYAKDMKKDLLGFMLNARDDAGLGLSDEIIRDQVITFLVAGTNKRDYNHI
jgi:cytochrome P450